MNPSPDLLLCLAAACATPPATQPEALIDPNDIDPAVLNPGKPEEVPLGKFLADMAALGDAMLAVTGAARLNYEMLGNSDPALHAHVFPRYADEPDEHRAPGQHHGHHAAHHGNHGAPSAAAGGHGGNHEAHATLRVP